jgi:hypothetical protein
MKITELFSKDQTSSKVSWNRRSRGVMGSAGYEIVVRDKSGKDLYYSLDIARSYVEGVYEVSFAMIDDQSYTLDITRTGNEFSVFSGVAASLRDFVATTREADALCFTAKEPSRIRLYRRLAARMASELGWNRDDQLAKLFFGGWYEGDGPEPFMIVRPGAEESIAKKIMGDEQD